MHRVHGDHLTDCIHYKIRGEVNPTVYRKEEENSGVSQRGGIGIVVLRLRDLGLGFVRPSCIPFHSIRPCNQIKERLGRLIERESSKMWHEARRSEKKVHDMMDAARKRAQRRAVFLAKRRGDPQQSIQVIGSRCRTYRDDGLYQATQDQQGLIPWNGKEDILIDRFDGRALLDFIREPDARRFRVQEKTEEEEELEEFVNFERYRDLIKHRRRGCRYFLDILQCDRQIFFMIFLSKLFVFLLHN